MVVRRYHGAGVLWPSVGRADANSQCRQTQEQRGEKEPDGMEQQVHNPQIILSALPVIDRDQSATLQPLRSGGQTLLQSSLLNSRAVRSLGRTG